MSFGSQILELRRAKKLKFRALAAKLKVTLVRSMR